MSELLKIIFALYGIMEIIITYIFINNILSDVIISDDGLYHNKSYIKLYLEYIYDELIYEDTFNFPLNKFRINSYTTFGMIFFMIAWIIIFSIPFVIAVIINFFLLRIAIFFKKLLFKDSRGNEDTHDIDH